MVGTTYYCTNSIFSLLKFPFECFTDKLAKLFQGFHGTICREVLELRI